MWSPKRTASQPSEIPRDELIKVYRHAIQAGVPIEAIEEKLNKLLMRSQVTERIETKDQQTREENLKKKVPKVVRYGSLLLPLTLVVVGILLIGSAALPIVNYFLATVPNLQASAVLSPVPNDKVLDVNPIVIAQVQATDGQNLETSEQTKPPIILDQELDYTNLTNWFTGAPDLGFNNTIFRQTQSQTYSLEIPKVNISNATVTIGGDDLSQSLIQYPGTADPGQFGAPVIFGHSVLRQFYNPSEKNSRRYTSIFSTIMTLKKGDEIYLTRNGKKYTYIVQDKTEVKPTDTFILTQKFDSKSLKLVTCTPEGTYLRRGVVTAQLVSQE